MILLGYRHDRMCPKCHYMMGTTTYFKGHHHPEDECGAAADLLAYRKKEPHPTADDIERHHGIRTEVLYEGLLPEDDPATPRELEWKAWNIRLWEVIAAIPEHFDRECPNCKYRWAEGVE